MFAMKFVCKNNLKDKEEPIMRNRKYFELTNNENTVFQNVLFVLKENL